MNRITYDFMISGKEALVADAIQYLKFLYSMLAFDNNESVWHKPPKADDCTLMTTTSFSTVRRREVLAVISCLKELSKESHDLCVDYIEISHVAPIGTTLFQIEKGRQRSTGHWPALISDVSDALTLRKLARANPTAAYFGEAGEAIIRYTSFDTRTGNAAGQIFADAIVAACVKQRVRQRRSLMSEVVQSLKRVKNRIHYLESSEFSDGEMVGYHELLSLIESLTLELDCTVPAHPAMPSVQMTRHCGTIPL